MYQVFNMGHRLEIFTDEASALKMIDTAKELKLDAQIIGRAEVSDKKELHLKVNGKEIIY